MKPQRLLGLALVMPSARSFVTSVISLTKKTASLTATIMRVTGIESTPNPSSFKFDLDETMHSSTRGVTYSTSTASLAPVPVQRVLEIPGVESIYALGDWLCLNKVPSAKWDSIVSAAVDALGGAAESLDPLTLMIASGVGEARSGWSKSGMDGIAIRVQYSNGIPIQVEACSPGGTPIRRKLSTRFADAMAEFVSATGDEMAFFKGRQWVDRGVRYPSEDEVDEGDGDATNAALSAAVAEIEQAFHYSRLNSAVASAVAALEGCSFANHEQGEAVREAETGAAEASAVRRAASALQSLTAGDVIAAVDTLCDLAAPVTELNTSEGDRESGRLRGKASAARDALDALIGFAGSGEGPVAARRAAVAFVGSAGDSAGTAGLEAVAAVFRGDRSPGVRRTAGDALSDLGDVGAVPVALAGLRDKSKLVRWRAARVVGELGVREEDAALLDETREAEKEFEVAFEMADAARKIKSRIATATDGAADARAVSGPVWKQIQERSSGS